MSALISAALNGVPIEDLNLALSAVSGWRDLPKRTYGVVTIPGTVGQRALSAGSSVDVRTFAFTFLVRPTSFTDRATQIAALASQFTGLVEVSTADAPTLVCYGLLDAMPVSTPYKAWVQPEINAAVTITCHDPRQYARNPSIINIPSGTAVALPMGSATTDRLDITVLGTTSNPIVLVLTDQTGAEVQRMTLTAPTGNLGASNWLTVYCGADGDSQVKSIFKSDGTDLYSWIGASEDFFTLWEGGVYSLSCAQAALRVAVRPANW